MRSCYANEELNLVASPGMGIGMYAHLFMSALGLVMQSQAGQ